MVGDFEQFGVAGRKPSDGPSDRELEKRNSWKKDKPDARDMEKADRENRELERNARDANQRGERLMERAQNIDTRYRLVRDRLAKKQQQELQNVLAARPDLAGLDEAVLNAKLNELRRASDSTVASLVEVAQSIKDLDAAYWGGKQEYDRHMGTLATIKPGAAFWDRMETYRLERDEIIEKIDRNIARFEAKARGEEVVIPPAPVPEASAPAETKKEAAPAAVPEKEYAPSKGPSSAEKPVKFINRYDKEKKQMYRVAVYADGRQEMMATKGLSEFQRERGRTIDENMRASFGEAGARAQERFTQRAMDALRDQPGFDPQSREGRDRVRGEAARLWRESGEKFSEADREAIDLYRSRPPSGDGWTRLEKPVLLRPRTAPSSVPSAPVAPPKATLEGEQYEEPKSVRPFMKPGARSALPPSAPSAPFVAPKDATAVSPSVAPAPLPEWLGKIVDGFKKFFGMFTANAPSPAPAAVPGEKAEKKPEPANLEKKAGEKESAGAERKESFVQGFRKYLDAVKKKLIGTDGIKNVHSESGAEFGPASFDYHTIVVETEKARVAVLLRIPDKPGEPWQIVRDTVIHTEYGMSRVEGPDKNLSVDDFVQYVRDILNGKIQGERK